MKHRLFRSALSSGLCLLLGPLLLAQETASGTPDKLFIPRNTSLSLMALDPVSSATATEGQAVRLVVARDLTQSGVTILRAGTPLTGTVSKVSRGVPGKKRAQLEIRVDTIPLGKNLSLRLNDQWKESRKEKANTVGLWLLAAPIVVLAGPLLIALLLEEGKGKPSGENIAYPPCRLLSYYVASDTMISTASLDPAAVGTTVDLQNLCTLPQLRRNRSGQTDPPKHSGSAATPAPPVVQLAIPVEP